MIQKAGLRTEIVISLTVLLAAALLFAGFLLIKLTERELLGERLRSATGIMETVARAILLEPSGNEDGAALLLAGASPLLQGLPPGLAVQGWGAAGRELNPLGEYGQSSGFRLEEEPLARVKFSGEPATRTHYSSAWLTLAPDTGSYLVVTVPILRHGDFLGALQARFSLADVRLRVFSAQKVMLICAVLYGSVLVLFGAYSLGRTVVRPVLRLQAMSRGIAAGNLVQAVPVEGPREIADLAGSFNAMASALRRSQQERESHIQALQKANEELRQTQDELIRSEKMASVGHLAAGMAHEIGNPLGAVVGYLEFLKGESLPGRQKEIVERALAESVRIDRLVRELLDYAAPGEQEMQTFDPAAAMVEALEILRHQGVFNDLELDNLLPPTLSATRMVRHQLVQVFINLLLNARDASPEGAVIRLCGGVEGELVWLSVADSGSGMAPEAVTHIFDPFFTTKDPGKGRGLGLAVCQRVIGDAGGRIEVFSRPEQGSEFTVWLKQVEAGGDDS